MATTGFRDAAAAQVRTLGFDAAMVWVEHPVQNRSTEELHAMADGAMEPILSKIRGRDEDDTH